ncbi:MAG: alanine racemase [Paracoccus sp. (in: a-proteobacteria)]|nr:alanine racemase [Paracoccus sp. (in: a-proteobacteria)]
MSCFAALAASVDAAGLDRAVLVLDMARLRANLAHLDAHLPQGYARRIADKSLPAPDLIATAMQALGTARVMSFDLALTARLLERFAKAEVLMGKPVPARAAAQFIATHPRADRVIWLIDSAARAAEYAALGPLRVAAEVDIGLGRGGFAAPGELAALQSPLHPVALMGYEAHVSGLPRALSARAARDAMARLAAFRAAAPWAGIINTGGSTTALGLPERGPANELTVGSALLKPSDFDQEINRALRPALFIVTPVLRDVVHGVPGLPRLSAALRAARRIAPRIAFVHGGKWMARPIWPEGFGTSPFYGASSNQQGFTHRGPAPARIVLRPTQSEAVIQGFSTIHLFDEGQITGAWPVWPPA